jgi:hypothetical protein
MKRALFFLVLVACSKKEQTTAPVSSSSAVAIADAGPADSGVAWVTYKAAKASMAFPGSFNVIFTSPDQTTFEVAGARGGDVSLRARADEALGPEIANPQKALDDHARSAASEDRGYTRVSIKPITLGTHSGREEVSKKDGNLVRVRVYLVGRRFYTLTADRKEAQLEAEPTVNRFLESLTVAE